MVDELKQLPFINISKVCKFPSHLDKQSLNNLINILHHPHTTKFYMHFEISMM